MHNEVDTCLPHWEKLYRLGPSHFPPIDLFENVANPDDLDIIFAIESLTNDRLRQEAGDLALVPEEQRISGIGTSPIMAAFTHIGTQSRFTDGTNLLALIYVRYVDLLAVIMAQQHRSCLTATTSTAAK
jgi:hypothetical protein